MTEDTMKDINGEDRKGCAFWTDNNASKRGCMEWLSELEFVGADVVLLGGIVDSSAFAGDENEDNEDEVDDDELSEKSDADGIGKKKTKGARSSLLSSSSSPSSLSPLNR
jgi:hypothetical protein